MPAMTPRAVMSWTLTSVASAAPVTPWPRACFTKGCTCLAGFSTASLDRRSRSAPSPLPEVVCRSELWDWRLWAPRSDELRIEWQ